jgi:hypothetical protein
MLYLFADNRHATTSSKIILSQARTLQHKRNNVTKSTPYDNIYSKLHFEEKTFLAELVKKFSVLVETLCFITIFTRRNLLLHVSGTAQESVAMVTRPQTQSILNQTVKIRGMFATI